MEENKEHNVKNEDILVEKSRKSFLQDLLSGICIGVAFIIPGFSGGSVAAILGIYERLISAITNVLKEFKESIKVLGPVLLGLAIGAISLMFPLGYVLDRFPLPTVSLFVGLAIGGIPSITNKIKGKPCRSELAVISLTMIAALLISFAPVGTEVDLFNIDFSGYVLLFLVGLLGSCALVIPGISGSMLLLILGYYNPIVSLITDHLFRFENLGRCILVLGICALGIASGFFLMSFAMKHLLSKYPRGTYFAIVGFILGSLPTVYISVMRSSGILTNAFEIKGAPFSPLIIAICLFLILAGACASYYLTSEAARASLEE